MIGQLPTQLEIGGVIKDIRSDFRDCLTILEAFNDPDLTNNEKYEVMLDILYIDNIEQEEIQEALDKAIWFLNCGDTVKDSTSKKPLYDWEQDEQIIFSAINKSAGMETRTQEYIHFWTFISYFYEIGEGLFSTVINIRNKKNKKKKLEKYEQEFYRENKSLIDLKKKYTQSELAEKELVNTLLGR